MFTLTFSDPAGKTESVPLLDEDRGLVVGRGADCDVVLASKEVSRRHARFFVIAGDLTVEDLGSHNGVLVAGRRIGKATPLVGAPLPDVELGDVRVLARSIARPAPDRTGAKSLDGNAVSAAPAPVRSAAQRTLAPGPAEDPRRRGVGAGAVLRGKGKNGAVQIALPARAVVGRDQTSDVVLDDDSVSRKHAEISRDDRGLYQVEDQGSANGTFIDGRRLSKKELIPEGATLRFGDIELLFWRPPAVKPPLRRKLLLVALLVLIALVAVVSALRSRRNARDQAAQADTGDDAAAVSDQAQAALESDHFQDAARLASQAIDLDPLAGGPRKLLAQAKREEAAAKVFADAGASAQVGREDEALRLYARVDSRSRFFARARIAAKDLAQALVRKHASACRAESSRERWAAAADQCGLALDIKCQSAEVDADPLFKMLRAAEKHAARRVLWSCPQELAPLFRDLASESTAKTDDAAQRAFAARYPDPALREAMTVYLHGDPASALRALSSAAVARGKSATLAQAASATIRLVDGRFREGQTALLRNELSRVDDLWGEALKAEAALLPPGTESFLGAQMRTTLAQAHAKAGDDRFAKGQYGDAYDQWTSGLAASPRDPVLLDSIARLEKVADRITGGGDANCDQIAVALHITRADPPSPAHVAAARALEKCQ